MRKFPLPYQQPFQYSALFRTYRAHAVGNLEWFDETVEKMHRVIQFGEKTGVITIADEPGNSRLLLTIDFPGTEYDRQIVARVRAVFDLDSDPQAIAKSLRRHAKLHALSKKHAGIRLPTGWDPFEVAVGTILGQLVSVQRGRALVNDLIDISGIEGQVGGRKIKFFPTPAQIAAADLTALGSTRARKETLVRLSRAILDGKISLAPMQDIEKFMKDILAIKGIGPWTANYIALRALGHKDAFPETDLILARALKGFSRKAIEGMRPWRGYLAALLWREHSSLQKAAPRPKIK